MFDQIGRIAVDAGLVHGLRILRGSGQHLFCEMTMGAVPRDALFWETHATGTGRMYFNAEQTSLVLPLVEADKVWGCLGLYRSPHGLTTREKREWIAFSFDLSLTIQQRLHFEKQAETEKFMSDLGNLVPGVFFKLCLSLTGKLGFRYVSPGIDLLLPFSSSQLELNSALVFGAIHPSDRLRFRVIGLRSCKDLTVFNLEFRLRRPNGMVVWILATAFPQREPSGETIWTGMAVDVTSQNRLQEALQREQDLLRVVVDNIEDGVVAVNEKGSLALLNRTAHRLLGQDGRPSEAAVRSWPWNAGEKFHPWYLTRDDGSTVHLEVQASDLSEPGHPARGAVLLLRDMTDHDRYEERLRRSEKLESIGLLAGGVAHDFNNLLTGLFGFIELAKLNADEAEKVRSYLGQAEGPFHRARNLTGQLLTFARGGEMPQSAVDPVGFLRDLVTSLFPDSSIAIVFDVAGTIPLVWANQVEFHQVFENLLINARQAVASPLKTGAAITLRLASLAVSSETFRGLPQGNYVQFIVEDNGPGVDSESLPKIFDPFFTTKSAGTGLGLSICYSIVKKHQGSIDLLYPEKPGARFRVIWPVYESTGAEL